MKPEQFLNEPSENPEKAQERPSAKRSENRTPCPENIRKSGRKAISGHFHPNLISFIFNKLG
ncbi:hypothetical protein CSB93_5349 [Pseudomonas paraeruginosa]|uniref:Uncharacterized protein n=1 Tax=Pseudomonas paraeruginosa TaxID=2994495 RepID=A0A2R3ITJ8_9PSED|nr:hypothetical protein CSB93_5349 [Pseudomonas paraeruginosa]AWE89671.1 hypothetical protein CSC28_4141 [Pseudomonas paraeruginosa]